MTAKLHQFCAARSGHNGRTRYRRWRRRQLDATQWCTGTRRRTIPERPNGERGYTPEFLAAPGDPAVSFAVPLLLRSKSLFLHESKSRRLIDSSR